MTTHKHEHEEQAHKPVATASTTVAGPLPGDPKDYVLAWVEGEEQSTPDADGQTHTVKVSKLGWKKV